MQIAVEFAPAALRRFAIAVIKSKGVYSAAKKMRRLACGVRSVFDYLKMADNSCTAAFP